MRTTISIPDSFYKKIKPLLKETGYASFNALVLELLRNHFKTKKMKHGFLKGKHGC